MAGDPFLSDPLRKRKRAARPTRPRPQRQPELDLSSGSSDDEANDANDDDNDNDDALGSDEEFAAESAADKRRRLAKQYLQNLKDEEEGDYDAQDVDNDLLARRLQEDVAENKGHVYKFYADKVLRQLDDVARTTARVGLRNLTGVAVRYPDVYTVAKDMELVKWRYGRGKPVRVRHSKGGLRHGERHHTAAINCVAVLPDGKYVVTGGADARLIIWAAESLACLKVLDTRAAVNAVAFRRGSDQLYAACADLRIRTFSVSQHAQLEILYGHQDNITDIAALARETCVLVGLRDKTAMFWKIAEELRLTFRGGDADRRRRTDEPFFAEGSIDVVSMVDELHFVTGLDNGSVALWSLSKKKPLHTQRCAHGLLPAHTPAEASAESSAPLAREQVAPPQPYWITAVHAVPYLDVFVTGSYCGEVRLWRIDRDGFRSFAPLGAVAVKGCVVLIDSAEVDKKLVLTVATSKEHRLGRWLSTDGRNALTTLTFDI